MSHPAINTNIKPNTDTTGYTLFSDNNVFFRLDKATGECWKLGTTLTIKSV